MRYSNKKFIVLVFAALILFLIAPKTTSAAVPTFETNPAITGGIQTTGISTAATIGEMSFEWAFKSAIEISKRQLLNMIVDQIVNWIQGGGQPKFITDWPAFFRDAVDQAGGKFIQQLGLGQLCSAFGPQLSVAFIPIPQFTTRTSCTMSQVGVNLDAFLQNFNNGGWVAWNQMILNPQNNIYGAYIMAWDQYEIEKSAAVAAAEAEAQAGRGFLSAKRCLESHVAVDYGTGASTTVCDKYEIVTPGAVVGDLAAKAVGSDIDYIVNADDFAAYVSAITNAILNRMFAEGVGLLHSSLSNSGTGSSGSGIVTGNGSFAQMQCTQLLGTTAYSACITSIQTGIDIREFQKNYLISLIDRDLAYQNQLLGAKQATLTVLNQSIDVLNQLNDCQGSTPVALAQVQNAASIAASQIPQIQSDIISLQVKQQEIKAITDVTQIPSLWAKVAGFVNPTSTQSLALAAQQETSQKQQDLSSYQQQLIYCQQQQQLQQQQQQSY
ncbi:MAG: hypothetical protein NT078_00755 [Candidatus Azambacteria bacterium]|nr:hypothetical protein [Candidatus Azambacteria bacterium]